MVALIDKPEDLEKKVPEYEELQGLIAEEIFRAKAFLEISQLQPPINSPKR